jgi:positive regulator of sigma E activity
MTIIMVASNGQSLMRNQRKSTISQIPAKGECQLTMMRKAVIKYPEEIFESSRLR